MGSPAEQPSGSSQPLTAMGWAGPASAGVGAALAAYLASSAGFPAGLVAAATVAGALGAFVTRAWARLPPGNERGRAARGSRSDGSQARQRLLAVVADSVPDAVVMFSEVGTIQYSNPIARDLFFEGQSPEGQNFIRLVSAAAAPLREALLGETDRFFSLEVDGRSESYHLSRRTFVADGEPLTLLVVKYMTREIRRREVEVLQRVIRVISHEVNNSLAPISSLMHSARKMASLVGEAERFARVFDTIDERASHLRTFLEGYAALARLPRPRLAEASWAALLAQVSTLYPEVKLPEPPVLPGWFDAAQLEQVVINLIKNAREAGSPDADIALEVRTDETLATELDVLDRGPGFSAEAIKNAVLPLYTTKPGGSGMGLALCREVADAHGGSLDVSNRNDGGARIRVRLPGRRRSMGELSRSRLTLTRG